MSFVSSTRIWSSTLANRFEKGKLLFLLVSAIGFLSALPLNYAVDQNRYIPMIDVVISMNGQSPTILTAVLDFSLLLPTQHTQIVQSSNARYTAFHSH